MKALLMNGPEDGRTVDWHGEGDSKTLRYDSLVTSGAAEQAAYAFDFKHARQDVRHDRYIFEYRYAFTLPNGVPVLDCAGRR